MSAQAGPWSGLVLRRHDVWCGKHLQRAAQRLSDSSHLTYEIIKAFLSDDDVLDRCGRVVVDGVLVTPADPVLVRQLLNGGFGPMCCVLEVRGKLEPLVDIQRKKLGIEPSVDEMFALSKLRGES